MRLYDTRESGSLQNLRTVFAARLEDASHDAEAIVREILTAVRADGDNAVLEYTRRFDFADARSLRVPHDAVVAAHDRIAQTPLHTAMLTAASRIRSFHEKQKRGSWMDTSAPGEILGQIVQPLARVGIYVPGGTASYPSTVLMTAVPAKVAGVESIALATPPCRDTGLPPDATLAAAYIAGVDEVYAMGGAQAVGALAYGTETIAAADKIVGPGNRFVNLAKRIVYGTVGIDMLAGPTEVALLADKDADVYSAAADLIAQAEHDPNGSVLVATDSQIFADSLMAAIETQVNDLPRRDIVRQVLANHGYLVVCADPIEAAAVVSLYAPEHLHLDVQQPWALIGYIKNSGAILVGKYVSAAIGDYLAGPSHTLPTAGCARWASPLNLDDFQKKSSLIFLDADAAKPLGEMSAVFADFEGLEGHARAARRIDMQYDS